MRIGSRMFRSDTIRLGTGEVRQLAIVLESIRPDVAQGHALARVTVSGATPCETARHHAVRIADLWEDASTALLATTISSRDSLVRRRLIRYERALDPATLAIQREYVRSFDAFGGAGGGFFTSIPADSLSRVGYWQRAGTGAVKFHGPDERALLSEVFLHDHCFTLDEMSDKPGEVALGFEPSADRLGSEAPEIRGVITLDSATSELRSVEFSWVTLPPGVPPDHLGGRIEYAALPWGPWYVHRWRLRMPEALAPGESQDGNRFGIVEEGGVVQAGGRTPHDGAPVTISGMVVDDGGDPLPGAMIAVAGTVLRTITDGEGRFLLERVPPGLQVVEAEHPKYDALGVRLAEVDVLLDEGVRRELLIRAPSEADVPVLLCGEAATAGLGTLRLTVVDGRTGDPVSGLRVTLAERKARAAGSGFSTQSRTDARGVVLFCGAPPEQVLVLTAGVSNRPTEFQLSLPAAGVKYRLLRLVPQ
jgi:hypothetical protein